MDEKSLKKIHGKSDNKLSVQVIDSTFYSLCTLLRAANFCWC
jgi:hypothetical protein